MDICHPNAQFVLEEWKDNRIFVFIDKSAALKRIGQKWNFVEFGFGHFYIFVNINNILIPRRISSNIQG